MTVPPMWYFLLHLMTEFSNTFPEETRSSHMVAVEFLLLKAPVCLRAVLRTIKMSGCQNYDVM